MSAEYDDFEDDPSGWVDITEDVVLEMGPFLQDCKICIPNWPGRGNVKIFVREEPSKLYGEIFRILRVGDVVKCNPIDVDVVETVFVLSFDGVRWINAVNTNGITDMLNADDILEIWRDGKAVWTASDKEES